MVKKIISLIIISIFMLYNTSFVIKADTVDDSINNALEYYKQSANDLHDFASRWWDIVALKGAGADLTSGIYTLPKWQASDFPQTPTQLDYIHFIFGGAALSYNPRDLGGKDLINLLSQKQLDDGSFSKALNYHIWAMITLDAFNASYNKDGAVNYLLTNEGADGGFPAGASDADITSMALIALSFHKGSSAVDSAIASAVGFLKTKQNETGGFTGYNGENSNTTAIAISGLIAVGQDINSIDWQKNGKTPLDGLLSFKNDSNAFNYKANTNDKSSILIATTQAVCALEDIKYGESVFKRIGEGQNVISPQPTNVIISDYHQKTVTLSVDGDAKTGNKLQSTTVNITDGDTPSSILKLEAPDIVLDSTLKYLVNGVDTKLDADKYILQDGDNVKFYYDNSASATNIIADTAIDKNDLDKKISSGQKLYEEFGYGTDWGAFITKLCGKSPDNYKGVFVEYIKANMRAGTAPHVRHFSQKPSL